MCLKYRFHFASNIVMTNTIEVISFKHKQIHRNILGNISKHIYLYIFLIIIWVMVKVDKKDARETFFLSFPWRPLLKLYELWTLPKVQHCSELHLDGVGPWGDHGSYLVGGHTSKLVNMAALYQSRINRHGKLNKIIWSKLTWDKIAFISMCYNIRDKLLIGTSKSYLK